MKKIIILLIIMFTPFIVNAKVYKLTYPDGSVYETEDYEEAQRLLSEWKLLKSDVTDANGEITLTDWLEEGLIKIVETKAPDGYIIDNPEIEINLSEKEATIINRKEEVIPNEVIPEKKEEPKEVKQNSKAKTPFTGDHLLIDSELFIISILVMGICIMLIKRIK